MLRVCTGWVRTLPLCLENGIAMAGGKKPPITPERVAEIRESIEAGRRRSMFDNPTEAMSRFHGAMCRCGLYRKPSGLAKHVVDDGKCFVHPDKEPEKGFQP